MKRLLFLCSLALSLAIIFYPSTTISNSSGSPGNMTGAPGENTCTACHSSFGLNTGPGTVSLTSNIPASGYTPGNTYTVTATILDSGINQFGFEAFGGDFLNINSSEMQSLAPDRITHTASGTQGNNSKSWTFDWVTPIGNPGALTLYASFVAADYPVGNNGDYVYSTSLTVSVAVPGCTDSLACNYDSLATIDDSSCVYPTVYSTAITICQGDSVMVGTNVYYNAGTYLDTIACDSIIETIVTIPYVYNGGIENNTGGGGFYSGNRALVLDCFSPSVLESATIYAQSNTNYTFELRDNNGNVLQSITTPLIQGPNRVHFDFEIPVGTDFELGVPGNHGGMYRDNQGVNYPYDFSNIVSIKSSNSGAAFSYYYFFYDIDIYSQHFVNDISICDGSTYMIGSNSYDSTGIYIDTLLSFIGCDSIVTTNLTVYPTYSIVNYDTLCNGQSVTVGTNTYDSTGVYWDTLITVNGCDSIIVTDLFVLSSFASFTTNNQTICEGDSIIVGNSIYLTSGTYADTLLNNVGCDSVVQTILNVIPTNNYLSYTICSGDSVMVGTSVYYQSGNYIDSLINSIGCDSIVYTAINVYNQFSSIQGGILDTLVGAGGYYSAQSQYLIFDCFMPTEILSALVYSQDTNLITFELRDDNGNVLEDTTHLLVPGAQRVSLGFDVNPATDLQLGVTNPGLGLYRSNAGAGNTWPYPFNFGSLASITSSNAGGQYYYFYYDIEMKPSSSPNNYMLCDGDTLHLFGNHYTTSGLYIDTLTSSIGCDSLIYSQVNFYPNVTFTNNQTICDGEVYIINGNSYDSTGTYIDSLSTNQGCDSVITTNLTVLTISSTGSTNLQTICVGESYSIANSIYSTAGTYYDTVISSQGCDSIITTILTINSPNYMSVNGGILDSTSAPGAFSNYDGHLIIDNNVLSILQAATVYAEDTNDVTFELRDNNGVVLESVMHTVYPGSQRLTFNFMIPVGNDFELGVDPNASGGVIGLYRSNAGAGNTWPYPFNLGPTTIKSSNAGDRYYYYYYDIEIMPYATSNKKFICKGDSIQVGTNIYDTTGNYIDTVGLSTTGCDSVVYTILDFYQSPSLSIQTSPDPPQICLGDSVVLEASDGFVFYWWNNGQSGHRIVDNPTQDTWYLVEAKDSNDCVVKEDIWVYVDSCITSFNNIPLNDILVYPNPTKDYINISFESLSLQNIELRIYNLLGEEVSSILLAEFYGSFNRRLDLRGYAKSIYFVEITTKDFVINKKIIFE